MNQQKVPSKISKLYSKGLCLMQTSSNVDILKQLLQKLKPIIQFWEC